MKRTPILRRLMMLTAALAFPSISLAKPAPQPDRCPVATELKSDAFALSIFRDVAESQSGNVVFSPYSLECVMDLLKQGAHGETLQLLESLPLGNLNVASAMAPLKANCLFVDRTMQLKPSVPPNIIVPVSFSANTQQAIDIINAWCSKNTKGCIPSLVDKSNITRDTRFVAANAIYLDAKWLRPFRPEITTPLEFTKSDATSVRVPFMCQTARFKYAKGDDWAAIAMFYEGNEAQGVPGCFIGILPQDDARTFTASLTPEKYRAIREALAVAKPSEVSVAMPTFETTTGSFSLKSALCRQGAAPLFNRADFSRFTDEPLLLSDVVQRCYVKVNEKGTKAAAVTGAIAGRCALGPRPIPIRFNRPFVWMITDLQSDATPYFMGIVEEPVAPKE